MHSRAIKTRRARCRSGGLFCVAASLYSNVVCAQASPADTALVLRATLQILQRQSRDLPLAAADPLTLKLSFELSAVGPRLSQPDQGPPLTTDITAAQPALYAVRINQQ